MFSSKEDSIYSRPNNIMIIGFPSGSNSFSSLQNHHRSTGICSNTIPSRINLSTKFFISSFSKYSIVLSPSCIFSTLCNDSVVPPSSQKNLVYLSYLRTISRSQVFIEYYRSGNIYKPV